MVEVRFDGRVEHLTWEEWERRARAGRIPPTAELRFEPVTGDAFRLASELEMYRSLTEDGDLAFRSRYAGSAPPVFTALLVGVQIRIWWVAQLRGPRDWLTEHGMNWAAPALEDREVWRVLSYGFLHTDFFHVMLNMMWCFYTGWNLERVFGARNVALLFLASTLGGGLLSLFGSPEVPSLGASGGVFGLVAASVVFGFQRPELLPENARRVFGFAMMPYLVLMFGSGLANSGTDNLAHFGGLLTGGLLVLLLDPPDLQRRPGWNLRVQGAWALGTLALFAALAAFGPRLDPLDDGRIVGVAKNKRDNLPATDTEVTWMAPASWRRGVSPARMTGTTSPLSDRDWGVRIERSASPASLDVLQREFEQDLEQAFGSFTPEGPYDALIASKPARELRYLVGGDDKSRVVLWRAAVAGHTSVEAVFEVLRADESRLEPLRQRLIAHISWSEPPDLTKARAEAEALPRSSKAQAALAQALSANGQVDAALDAWARAHELDPAQPRYLLGMLQTLSGYSSVIADFDARLQPALDRLDDPAIAVALADAYAHVGNQVAAIGLLQQAWIHAPGDRALRRQRQAMGMPSALSETGVPLDLALLPFSEAPRDPAAALALAEAPNSLDAAIALGQEWLAARDALVASINAESRPDRLASLLVQLETGRVVPSLSPTEATGLNLAISAIGGPRAPSWSPPTLVLQPEARAALLQWLSVQSEATPPP